MASTPHPERNSALPKGGMKSKDPIGLKFDETRQYASYKALMAQCLHEIRMKKVKM